MIKKFINYVLFILVIVNFSNCYATSNITYFYGKAPKIESDAVKILSNEFKVDITNSKIENVILLKNETSGEIETDIILPLEDEELSISINNLYILINDFNVEPSINSNNEYVISTRVPAGSGKKVEIVYYTDNDLQNARVIKYDMQNFSGEIVGKVKVDVVIDEKNIPLVDKVYPRTF